MFSNPIIPYSWEADDEDQKGWFCLFTEHFYRMEAVWGTFRILRCFKIGGTPVFFVDEAQQRCFQIFIPK
jgi:hypothetical protein